ncbi:hypothetical protein SAMN06265370_104264 [Puniceibacterium sediminis]|uniref:Uncharacterized protein n=1 Tax=Puniceibacterium sediminis TaxID=1608407 RepID=A0A238W919_9RHOB|nr:hypothetical protein SAMN06265370_104264 [Puniceibacterium sediminis]
MRSLSTGLYSNAPQYQSGRIHMILFSMKSPGILRTMSHATWTSRHGVCGLALADRSA